MCERQTYGTLCCRRTIKVQVSNVRKDSQELFGEFVATMCHFLVFLSCMMLRWKSCWWSSLLQDYITISRLYHFKTSRLDHPVWNPKLCYSATLCLVTLNFQHLESHIQSDLLLLQIQTQIYRCLQPVCQCLQTAFRRFHWKQKHFRTNTFSSLIMPLKLQNDFKSFGNCLSWA